MMQNKNSGHHYRPELIILIFACFITLNLLATVNSAALPTIMPTVEAILLAIAAFVTWREIH